MSYKDLPQNILFGYSSASDWAFTQNMTDNGELGTDQISSAAWNSDWQTLATFTTHDKYGNSSMYVLGSGNSNKTIFIQRITALGALSVETYRKEADQKYTSCCAYNASGSTFVFLQSKDYHWEILKIRFDGKVEESIQTGKWKTYYEQLFSVVISNIVYIVGHSSDGNRFFTQKIDPSGKLGQEMTNVKWNNYYDTLVPIKVGNKTFIWGQKKGDKKWFTQQIMDEGKLAAKEADKGTWEYYYGSATSYIGVENNTNTTYFFAQTSSDKNKWFTQKINDDGYFDKTENKHGNFFYYYSFISIIPQPNREPKNAWMGVAYNYLKDKTLKQIIIPGSHDSGMYKTTECTSLADASKTQTQGSNIYDQLLQGARYFDLRVVAQYKDGGDVEYKIAHVTDVGKIVFDIGYKGCLGPSMDEVFNDIVKYAADPAHKSELVILKFSHFKNCCWPGFAEGWNADRQKDFTQYLTKKIGDYLVRYQGGKRIGELTYSEILASGNSDAAKILVVIESLHDTVRDPAAGLYRYKDYNPKNPNEKSSKSADLYVYDKYSNTDDLEQMMESQHKKYVDPNNHGGDMYLLSWTLTHDGVTSPSVEAMAHTANSRLPSNLYEWYKAGEINTTKMPNIIYVDYLNELEAEISHTLMEMIYKK